MSAPEPQPRRWPRSRWWALVPVIALLSYATALRAPLVVVSPLLPEIRADLGLDAAQAGLLTSIPVLCFGILTPAVSRLLQVAGINHAALYGLIGIIAGSVIRSWGGTAEAFIGTAVIGASIAIGNLAVPMLIGRQFQHRAALLTGAYSSTTNLMVTLATAFAAPVAIVVGWRWSAAWGGIVLGSGALALWIAVYPPGVRGARAGLRLRAGLDEPAGRVAAGRQAQPPVGQLRRWRVTWLLAAAFSGHTLAYYALTAWLPTLLADVQGMTVSGAGAASSLFQAAGILGPIAVPALAGARGWSTMRITGVISACWVALPIGLILAPQAWAVWSLLAGAAQGAFFTVIFMIVIRRARDVDENRRLSATVQTIGYSVAATGPVVMGWAHERTGSWNLALLVVVVAIVAMATCAMLAIRDQSAPPDPMPA